MTLTDIYNILEASGYPVAYLQFPAEECPAMPFITYQETGSDNFGADGKVYQHAMRMQTDLFAAQKDPEAEKALEKALDDAGIYWEKYQTVDDTEACQRYTYEFTVIGG